jgi:hypothetical protein
VDRPTKKRDEFSAQQREKYLSVLREPIPPNLKALVEKLRDMERAKNTPDKPDNSES